MKKSLITLTLAACLSLAGVTNALALSKSGYKDKGTFSGRQIMHSLKDLSLSEEQKQSIRAVIKTTKENNSVYAAEKSSAREQFKELMNLPSWDESRAQTLVREQMQSAKALMLNRAKARHQVFHLLTAEQQAKLAAKKEQKMSRLASKKAKRGKGKARLAKALNLSDEQKVQWKAIRQETKDEMLSYKEASKAHKEDVRAVINADTFDEEAWLTLYDQYEESKIKQKLAQTKVKYDSYALLSDEQKSKFAKIMQRAKKGRS